MEGFTFSYGFGPRKGPGRKTVEILEQRGQHLRVGDGLWDENEGSVNCEWPPSIRVGKKRHNTFMRTLNLKQVGWFFIFDCRNDHDVREEIE